MDHTIFKSTRAKQQWKYKRYLLNTIRDDLCVEMTQKLYNTHRNFIEISKSLFTRKINILFYRIKDTYCCSFEFNFIWLLFSFPYVRVFEKYDATSKYKKETTTKCSTALKRQKIWTKQNRWFVQVEHIYIKWLWNFLIRFMYQI